MRGSFVVTAGLTDAFASWGMLSEVPTRLEAGGGFDFGFDFFF
jgi:hypothetical protein